MDGVKFEYNDHWNQITKNDSEPMILISIFDDIVMRKINNLPIYAEPKFSILSYKSTKFYKLWYKYI